MRILCFILIAGVGALQAQQFHDKSHPQELPKGTAGLSWQVLNINNLWTWHRSDGEGNHSPGGDDGAAYPQFTARCIYEDNLVFGGVMYVNNWPENGGVKASLQPVRVNGGSYLSNHGMTQGWVTGSGASANYTNSINDPLARIFRIRRDYTEMTPSERARDASIVNEQLSAVDATQAMIEWVMNQYQKDWDEWPAQFGAPFIDRNRNGVYDPPPPFSTAFTVDSLITGNYDEPGVASPDGIPADQVLFTVFNSLDRTKGLVFSGSEPMGLEIQKTVWGYKSSTELPDHYFVRYRLINKGGVDVGGGLKSSFFIDSLIIGQWSDIDVGNAGDDLYACDTLLHLGYAYNGNATDNSYLRFSLSPPSVGYSILSGPLVSGAPSDSGVFGFRRVHGKKNLMMSAFAPWKTGDPYSTPPFSDYPSGAGRWWFMLQGYAPVGQMGGTPTPYVHLPGDSPNPFPFSGDPITQTGHIDGLKTNYSFAPGDVRELISSGPSRLAPGDTVEFVVAVAVGLGADRLSSITVMKRNIVSAREAYSKFFEFARAPEKPAVRATALNGEVILDWGSDQAKNERVESRVIAESYRFQGYDVYQLPSKGAALWEGVRIATFDLKDGVKEIRSIVRNQLTGIVGFDLVQKGTDSGIQRFIHINEDKLQDVARLYNGREYYFAVTAYNYSPDITKNIRTLESDPSVVTVIPQIPFGAQIESRSGDSLSVVRIAGTGNGSASALVFDPLRTTGHSYEIRVDTLGFRKAVIKDLSANTDIVSASFPQTGVPLILNVDGIQITLADTLTVDDMFSFTSPGLLTGNSVLKSSARRVNVYPNPYVAGWSYAGEPTQKYVTFNNLPQYAKIRIFNLAGQLVRTLEKNDLSQFMKWDLTNEYSWQVGSGIYICRVEMPDIGETKILKLALVLSEAPPTY